MIIQNDINVAHWCAAEISQYISVLGAYRVSQDLHIPGPHPTLQSQNSNQTQQSPPPQPDPPPPASSPLAQEDHISGFTRCHHRAKDLATFMHLDIQQPQQFDRVPIACSLFFKPNLHHNDGFFPHDGRSFAQPSLQQLYPLIKTASRATACLASVHSSKDSRHSRLRNAANSTTSTATQQLSVTFELY